MLAAAQAVKALDTLAYILVAYISVAYTPAYTCSVCRGNDYEHKRRIFMATMTESELRAGVIFGDINTAEYVYMPAGELGMENPVCVYEWSAGREDVELKAAMSIIRRRSLRHVSHPRLGRSSC